MKRLLFAAVLCLLPAALFAQVADRDVLLAPDGTLYTIESVADGDATRNLTLTATQADKSITSTIPDTAKAGANSRPALAYDADSKTLFVLWIYTTNGLTSEVKFTSYHDGKWQRAVAIDEQSYNFCTNLHVAVTHKISTLQADGTFADAPGLLVHAVWWEYVGATERARYALLNVETSRAETHNLSEFAIYPDMPFTVDQTFNPEILRHPALIEGTDSVDVVFGDTERLAINRVTLKPIADGRLHIPVGHKGGPPFGPPQSFSANWTGHVSTVASGSNLLMYNIGKDTAGFVMFSNGRWSDVHTLPLSDTFSGDAAAAAFSKMLASQ